MDVIASLPMTYVGMITAWMDGSGVTDDKGSRLLKATRIVRLAKMLRVGEYCTSPR